MIPRSKHEAFCFVITVIFFCNPTVRGIPLVTGSPETINHNTSMARCQNTYKNLTKGKFVRCKSLRFIIKPSDFFHYNSTSTLLSDRNYIFIYDQGQPGFALVLFVTNHGLKSLVIMLCPQTNIHSKSFLLPRNQAKPSYQ